MKRFLSIIITLSLLITSSLIGIHADTSKGSEKSDGVSETQTTIDTTTTQVITRTGTVYRVHVGDFNGSGTDIITETASSDFAYRSKVFINRGYPTEFEPMTIQLKLRTYFYIDYK